MNKFISEKIYNSSFIKENKFELIENEKGLLLKNNRFNIAFTYSAIDAKNKDELNLFLKENDFSLNIYNNKQVHSDIVNVYESEKNNSEGDALISYKSNVSLIIYTADCVPIILFNNKNKSIANIHAGWRGTYNNIVGKTINKINSHISKDNLCAIIGPSIGICCYEVSFDLINRFSELFKSLGIGIDKFEKGYLHENRKYYLNLKLINKYLLINSGIEEKNILDIDICNSCNSQYFHSYRSHNKTEKRIGTIIQSI